MNPDDPTKVALLMDVPDMEKFTSAIHPEAAAEAMKHDGVSARNVGDPRRGIGETASDHLAPRADPDWYTGKA